MTTVPMYLRLVSLTLGGGGDGDDKINTDADPKKSGIFGTPVPPVPTTTTTFGDGIVKPAAGFGAFSNFRTSTEQTKSGSDPTSNSSPSSSTGTSAFGAPSTFGKSSFGSAGASAGSGFGQVAFWPIWVWESWFCCAIWYPR
jgi:nucleoporin NUP159